MVKPLWKFLQDGGISAVLEYGKIDSIALSANCASWANGDLLYMANNFRACLPGRLNNSNSDISDNSYSVRRKFMDTRFTADMIANGAKFIGLGDKVPSAPHGYHIAAAFYAPTRPDFHFVRQHPGNIWTERDGGGNDISIYNEKISSLYDLAILQGIYRTFKGWFAIPEDGIQCDAASAIYNFVEQGFFKNENLPIELSQYINEIKDIHIRRNEILDNVQSLEKLESDFESLDNIADQVMWNSEKITEILEKYNRVKFPAATNSPGRDLTNFKQPGPAASPASKEYSPARPGPAMRVPTDVRIPLIDGHTGRAAHR
ncbi:MAG: hypothetical protein LBR41_01190 [Rickettsiales bacterium]|jgi:hypothetical protein|nr:hypothetical protein [Rickettsiales bacterium]